MGLENARLSLTDKLHRSLTSLQGALPLLFWGAKTPFSHIRKTQLLAEITIFFGGIFLIFFLHLQHFSSGGSKVHFFNKFNQPFSFANHFVEVERKLHTLPRVITSCGALCQGLSCVCTVT